MPDHRATFGQHGEELACRHLQRAGCAILARRYRRRGGEIDIVARDGDTLVFVEVKARVGVSFGGGADAVTALKQRRIVQLARDYVMRHHVGECPCRFDVIAIDVGSSATPSIEWYKSAFDAA